MANKKNPTSGSKSSFTKLLVANRGEIACRIFSACKKMGITTVAVYSEADRNARHTRLADEKVCIGPGPAKESYLNIPAVIGAAKKSGAQAIHPGYGFLSERSVFAQAVLDAGLLWVGPTPEVIDMMGSKTAAKKIAEKAGVPTLPWSLLKADSPEKLNETELLKAAHNVGYPLLLKASAGGGGRGMRLVTADDMLMDSARAAMREAQASFGSGELFLESYKEAARHVEVQILGDKHGQIFCFGERDCSAQRRHQKVIEEAPAPNFSQAARKQLWDYAVSLGKQVGYQNAGTCEFLVDKTGSPYFLEMNTRLQVEHPVSELVWGVDLVELQLRVTAGEQLPKELAELTPKGHAVEVRLYAENPAKNFMPSPGIINEIKYPSGTGLRVDAGYESGDEVSIHYDAMLAKIIAYGSDRAAACSTLVAGLRQTVAVGVQTNTEFLVDLIEHPEFSQFSIDTKWIERTFKNWTPKAVAAIVGSPWFYYAKGPTWKKPLNAEELMDQSKGNQGAVSGSNGPLTSEHPGKVLSVKVKAGQKVSEGQILVVCESMKMEFNYNAPCAGVVKNISVKEGDVVAAGAELIRLENL